MLDIIDIAREKGIQEGKTIGIREGKLEAAQEMLTDAVIERFDMAPVHISERIREIRNTDTLKGLFRQVLKCQNIGEFEAVLKRV